MSDHPTDPAIDVRACMPTRPARVSRYSHAEAVERGDRLIEILSALRADAHDESRGFEFHGRTNGTSLRRRFRWALYVLGKRIPDYASR